MQDDNECCGTCMYHRKVNGEWVCCNPIAYVYTLETEYQDGHDCPDWEERY